MGGAVKDTSMLSMPPGPQLSVPPLTVRCQCLWIPWGCRLYRPCIFHELQNSAVSSWSEAFTQCHPPFSGPCLTHPLYTLTPRYRCPNSVQYPPHILQSAIYVSVLCDFLHYLVTVSPITSTVATPQRRTRKGRFAQNSVEYFSHHTYKNCIKKSDDAINTLRPQLRLCAFTSYLLLYLHTTVIRSQNRLWPTKASAVTDECMSHWRGLLLRDLLIKYCPLLSL